MSKKLLKYFGILTVIIITSTFAWILLSMFNDEKHQKKESPHVNKVNLQSNQHDGLKFDDVSGAVIVGDSGTFKNLQNIELHQANEVKRLIIKQNSNYSSGTVVYPLLIKSAPLSKDMVIYRVIYDNRKRDGFQNATVFFIDASLKILQNDWIVGCGVGNLEAAHYKVSIYAGWWCRLHISGNFFQYEHLYVHCFDLPAKEGDKAFLIYKTGEFSSHYVVESLYPLTVPSPKVHTHYQNTSISVATCFNANTKNAIYVDEGEHTISKVSRS